VVADTSIITIVNVTDNKNITNIESFSLVNLNPVDNNIVKKLLESISIFIISTHNIDE
jgi:hypothetical protein